MLPGVAEVSLAGSRSLGFSQRHDPRPARIGVLGESLDRVALAGCVAALEHHDQPLTGGLDPVLKLRQLDLQQPLGETATLGKRLDVSTQRTAGLLRIRAIG